MIAEPQTTEKILDNDNCRANHNGVGKSQTVITRQAVATKDCTADDGLEQIVGKTHATEDAEMMEHSAYALESIPGRYYR